MKRSATVAFSLLMMSTAPASLAATGRMLKITITGAGLTTPIEITDQKIREFSVWAGPGVEVNGVEQAEGFIIDWSKGVVAQRPAVLRDYEVSFYSNFRRSEGSIVYIVSYADDSSTGRGFVYLPGKADEWFKLNASTMFHGHGLEGNWFRATSAWESFVRPLIARARATGGSR
jgi:hypothetical protein